MIDLSIDIDDAAGRFHTAACATARRSRCSACSALPAAARRRCSKRSPGSARRTRGEIRIGDRMLFSSAKKINLPARDRRIGYVPQDALLFPNMNVDGNINYGRS